MRRGGHATKTNASAKLRAWRASARCRAVLYAAAAKGKQTMAKMPKCGARTRSGEPCRTPPMENGRCRRHGGSTPSGAGWHKLKLPARGAKRGLEKFEAKLAKKARRDSEKFQRLAAMSPAERERHEAWQASHQPGSASVRAQRRQQRQTKQMLKELRADRAERAALGERAGADEEVDIFA